MVHLHRKKYAMRRLFKATRGVYVCSSDSARFGKPGREKKVYYFGHKKFGGTLQLKESSEKSL